MKLKGKVAIVTGASRGLGKAIAIGLAKEGVAITIAARTGIAYGVSKAAIERFTWGVAAEVGKFNIAVNCVKPRGSIKTEGMELLNPDSDGLDWDPPDRLVRAVAFLAGQDASGVSGSVATDEEICAWHGLL